MILLSLFMLLLAHIAHVESWKPSLPVSLQRKVGILSTSFLCLLTLSAAVPPAHAGMPALDAALKANEVTYSNNAKNFQRMGEGDYSMGRKDTSTSDRAVKRRAMNGCKDGALRKLASMSEKECNQRVIQDDYQFMIDAMEKQR